MKPIYIFQHVAAEGPGYFGDYLDRQQIPYTIVRLDAGDAVPRDLTRCSALVFMGGPMSVNDDLPWIAQELALIRQAQAAGLPLANCYKRLDRLRAQGVIRGRRAVRNCLVGERAIGSHRERGDKKAERECAMQVMRIRLLLLFPFACRTFLVQVHCS